MNSIAFGTLPLWIRMNEGLILGRSQTGMSTFFCRYREETGRSADIAKATQMTELRNPRVL